MNGVGSLQISPLAWKFVVSNLVRYKVIDIKVSSDVVDADACLDSSSCVLSLARLRKPVMQRARLRGNKQMER